MTWFEGNLPLKRQSERERETEREREWERARERERKRKKERTKERQRERESERVRCQMIWLTAGNRAPQVEFLSSVLPVLWMCITVFAWFTPSLVDCRVWSQVLALGGPIALQCFVDISDKKLLHTKVVFNHFDRDSYVCTYVSIFKHEHYYLWLRYSRTLNCTDYGSFIIAVLHWLQFVFVFPWGHCG